MYVRRMAQYDERAVATTLLRGSLRRPEGERSEPTKRKHSALPRIVVS